MTRDRNHHLVLVSEAYVQVNRVNMIAVSEDSAKVPMKYKLNDVPHVPFNNLSKDFLLDDYDVVVTSLDIAAHGLSVLAGCGNNRGNTVHVMQSFVSFRSMPLVRHIDGSLRARHLFGLLSFRFFN